MHNDSHEANRGTTPYTAPSFIIYENKKFKYDEIGEIKAIVDIVTTEQKSFNQQKKRLVKYFSIALAVCIVVDIIRVVFFTFDSKKWEKIPALRVTTIGNLISESKADKMDQEFINVVIVDRASFTDDDYINLFNSYRSYRAKNCLLYKSADEINDILGEPVRQVEEFDPLNMTPEQKDLDEAQYGTDYRRLRNDYYYAFDFLDETCLIKVRYYDNIAVSIEKVTEARN